ncbi:MAG: sugar phosphate isomerase/epimerase [Tannerella sp.]|jgi:sugar phosphate isomerase/epimerase|nr:sugar phosphate isomerase/epimerase [Tannerella sp.]
MAQDRRSFLKGAFCGATSAVIGGGMAAACSGASKKKEGCGKKDASCCPKKACCKDVKLNLSFQEGTPPGANLKEKFDFMEKLGITGLEPGGNGLGNRVKEFKDALSGRNIKVSAICAGFSGFILAEDEKVRQEFFDTMHPIIEAAGELGSTGVIMVPAFNGQKPVKPHTQETRDFLCEQLDKLGTFAVQHHTTVILEPLNRGEAFYLRQLADAASICRDVNNSGITCLGDFWHMTREETCDMAAFLSAGKYLQHVHMASRKRRSMPGEDGEADNYIAGFKGLKMIGYDKYVSFECGCKSEDRAATVTAAVKLLRDQWEQA